MAKDAQRQAHLQRLGMFAWRHPSLFLTLVSGAVGVWVIVLYAALWLGRVPPMDGFASGVLVVLAVGIGLLSFVVVLVALFPVLLAIFSGISRWELDWLSREATIALAFSGPLVWWAILIGANVWKEGVKAIGKALQSPGVPAFKGGVVLSLAAVFVVVFVSGMFSFLWRSFRREARVALLTLLPLLLLVVFLVRQLSEVLSGTSVPPLLSMSPLVGAPAISVVAVQLLRLTAHGRENSLAFLSPGGVQPWRCRWNGFLGALVEAVAAGFWAWVLAVLLLNQRWPYWVFGACWAASMLLVVLYHRNKGGFVAFVCIVTALAGFSLLFFYAQPIRLLGMGLFYTNCSLEQGELRLVRRGVARLFAEKGFRAPSSVAKAPEKLAEEWVSSLACEDIGGGRLGCRVYVWWSVGNTWLVSSPRDGVASAMERPDWKGSDPWAPLLIELRNGPTRCTRATGGGRVPLIRTIP